MTVLSVGKWEFPTRVNFVYGFSFINEKRKHKMEKRKYWDSTKRKNCVGGVVLFLDVVMLFSMYTVIYTVRTSYKLYNTQQNKWKINSIHLRINVQPNVWRFFLFSSERDCTFLIFNSFHLHRDSKQTCMILFFP